MGRSPVRLKEVVYGVSSNKVEIMGSLARDALSATAKKIGGGWFDVTVFGIAPLVGTVMCVVLCVVVVVVSCCVFSSGFWWCSFFLCGRGLVRGWRRLVAFFVTPFCRSVATSIGATGSGKVRRSPSVRSHLCRSHRGSNRKSLTVNISLSLSFSRTGTRRTTKNKRNSTTDSKQQREKKKKKKKKKKKLGSRLPLHCV